MCPRVPSPLGSTLLSAVRQAKSAAASEPGVGGSGGLGVEGQHPTRGRGTSAAASNPTHSLGPIPPRPAFPPPLPPLPQHLPFVSRLGGTQCNAAARPRAGLVASVACAAGLPSPCLASYSVPAPALTRSGGWMPPNPGPCVKRARTAAGPAKSVSTQGRLLPRPAPSGCAAALPPLLALPRPPTQRHHPPRPAGECIANAKDCGQEGKVCCVTSTPSTTNYWCLSGFYCPWGDAQDQPCKRCPPPEDAERDGVWECSQAMLDSKARGDWY